MLRRAASPAGCVALDYEHNVRGVALVLYAGRHKRRGSDLIVLECMVCGSPG